MLNLKQLVLGGVMLASLYSGINCTETENIKKQEQIIGQVSQCEDYKKKLQEEKDFLSWVKSNWGFPYGQELYTSTMQQSWYRDRQAWKVFAEKRIEERIEDLNKCQYPN